MSKHPTSVNRKVSWPFFYFPLFSRIREEERKRERIGKEEGKE
jgi:hypothetical protein